MQMIEKNIAEYFAMARERYLIHQRRLSGESRPWTEDPVFQAWRFCNVFREDDRTTKWIDKNVRGPLRNQSDDRMVTAMVACRLFNRIEILERIQKAGLLQSWDGRGVCKVLKDVHPVVGAAYMIKTPTGMDKLHGVVAIVDTVQADSHLLAEQMCEHASLEFACDLLQRYSYIGSFLAYEIVSDLRWTPVLERATDVMTWSVPGPGACRGLSWLVAGNSDEIKYGSRVAKEEALGLMGKLLRCSQSVVYWPQEWPMWEMREVEHFLCEMWKYAKVKYLNRRMKRRFYLPSP